MNVDDVRVGAVTALVALARSEVWTDRRDAAVALASFLDSDDAQAALYDLLLDGSDTAVTRAATAAVARQADARGWAVITLALASADDDQGEWIGTGVGEGVGWSEPGDRDIAVTTAARLLEHPEPHIRLGAQRLMEMLTES